MLSTINKFFNNPNKTIKKYSERLENILNYFKEYSNYDQENILKEYKSLKIKMKENWDVESENRIIALVKRAFQIKLNIDLFDVQIVGGIVLNEGKIAEMKTGEGKTFTAVIPVVIQSVTGKQIHIATSNDYLAKRDSEQLKEIYDIFEISCSYLYDNMSLEEKVNAYQSNVIYGKHTEFAYDHLRTFLATNEMALLQKEHFFAIVDEVDFILIDDARNPLHISGVDKDRSEDIGRTWKISNLMKKDEHFEILYDEKDIVIKDEGISLIEKELNIDNLFEFPNHINVHYITQALKANYLYNEGKDYIIQDEIIKIIDENTGRIVEGSRYGDNLHQMLEIKEKLEVKPESISLASTTYQNYFRLYDKLSGMSGTAKTDQQEFFEFYKLEVESIPPNKELKRIDYKDEVYITEEEKNTALINYVKDIHKTGQPVIVGTLSVKQSELISDLLKENNIEHTTLNAKNHKEEAKIIENAGLKGKVTVVTNMAGRGVDIKLGEGVNELGGLAIVAAGRYENRRIDNQLRGRSGRQGDNGSSKFFISFDDELLSYFEPEKLQKIAKTLKVPKGQPIVSSLVTAQIEKAQHNIENMYFQNRKTLVQFDEIIENQRKQIYKYKSDILLGKKDPLETLHNYINEMVTNIVDEYSLEESPEETKKEIMELFGVCILPELYDNCIKKDTIEEKTDCLILTANNFIIQILRSLDKKYVIGLARESTLGTLDILWREHMSSIETLKTGIGLRAINNKDPFIEFQKESFHLFTSFMSEYKIISAKRYLSFFNSLNIQIQKEKTEELEK